MSKNPLLNKFETQFQVPDFDQIKPEHYIPAINEAIKKKKLEIESIIKNPTKVNFNNTIKAFVNSGELLNKIKNIFFCEIDVNSKPLMENIEEEISTMLSSFNDEIFLNNKLFEKVKNVYNQNENLNSEQKYTLVNIYKTFIRSGTNLTPEKKEILKKINHKLTSLKVKFSQNLLKENQAYYLVIENKEDLIDLPQSLIDNAKEIAKTKGMTGKWIFTTDKPSFLPFLQMSPKRKLREKLFNSYINRCNNNNTNDNKEIISEIFNLRLKKSKLLGYNTYADYVLETKMAKKPKGVYLLLQKLWDPAIKVAKEEVLELQKIIELEGEEFKLAPWDWWFYAEKLRKEKYNIADSELRPYFKLENVIQGAFWVANKLYGLSFTYIENIPKPHQNVLTYEVKDNNNTHLGVIYFDFHPRKGKRVGAWCGNYRDKSRRTGKQTYPVITIACNFTKAIGNNPALLSLDEVETLFHEFGHALDSLMNNNTYAITFVARDFVELPSQIMEHWATEPDVLKQYAKHYKTGENIPDSLISKIEESRFFNQGFETVEYLASSFLDMEYHTITENRNIDIVTFEKKYFNKLGLIPEIVPRYYTTYFAHIIGGYSAGYYSYIWSGVLDNDAFQAFKETNIFDKKTAILFRKNILEKNGIEDPAILYKRFRGRDPKIDALLKNKGLDKKK